MIKLEDGLSLQYMLKNTESAFFTIGKFSLTNLKRNECLCKSFTQKIFFFLSHKLFLN
jgi:hypothetical protein